MQSQNQEIVLAAHPKGVPTADTFEIREIAMPELTEDGILIKSIYVSVDPGMRGFMDQGEDDAAGTKFELNKPITSRSVAQVMASNHPDFAVGDIVHGRFAWQKFQSVSSKELEKVDPSLAPISTAVSLLGVPGLAAYFGMLKVANIQPTDTVVVSGAAGSVGSTAAQIAKIHGCKVVGIAGSAKKIAYLESDLGLDKGINYKSCADMTAAIAEACPDGVDVFFDNVGGELFDAVFANINTHARIAICGQISEYNDANAAKGPRPMHKLIKKSARMEGFVVFNYADEFAAAKKKIAKWYNEDKLTFTETLTEGFENIPKAFIGLFSGENIGKQMVKVADLDS